MRAAGLMAAALLALPQVAHTRTDPYAAGPYTVTVTSDDPVQVDRATPFAIALSPADGATVLALALPGPGTAARPGRALTAAGGAGGRYVVTASFPVRGAWVLALDVAGPAGRGRAAVPLTVAAPGAIPQWLGWTIGLSPLLGLAVFLAAQVGRARRLRAARRPDDAR